MRFLSIYKTVERTSPPTQEEMAAMGKLIEEGMKAGWLPKEEAVELAKKFLQVAGEGECELRQLYEPGVDSNCTNSARRAEVALKA